MSEAQEHDGPAVPDNGGEPPTMSDLLGRKIGQYEILSELGRGGMATVFLANQSSMNRQVAIKILPREFLHDPQFIQRFEREVDTIAQLEHPHILPVYDYGQADRIPYIVMRYLRGGTLRDWLREGLPPLANLESPITQICSALDYAHAEGIIHRDLKPSNVLLDERSNAYLADFGIAKIMEDAGQLTGSRVIGTPAYMSPEQAEGRPLDARSDIYAMAVVVFELLTGREPFQADTPMAMLIKQISEPMPSPRVFRPELSTATEQVILKATSKDPASRYAAASDFATAFSKALSAPPGDPATPGLERTFVPGADFGATSSGAITGAGAEIGHMPTSTPGQPITPPPGSPPASGMPQTGGRRGLYIALAAIMIIALIGGGLLLASGALSSGPAPTEAAVVPSATPDPTNTPGPPPTLPPPTPFAEANIYRGPNDVLQVSIPSSWDRTGVSGSEGWFALWSPPARNALVSLFITPYTTGENVVFEDALQIHTEAMYGDERFFTLIDSAPQDDGSIRYSYRVPQLDGLREHFGRGQLDVFFYQAGANFLRMEIFIADDADQTRMLPLMQNILESLHIDPDAVLG